MSHLINKLLIILILAIIILILSTLLYLFYKTIIRPLRIKTFHYKKVLVVAQLILNSSKDNKTENLIKNKIFDIDLIKIAEKEILISKIKAKNIEDLKNKKVMEAKYKKWMNKQKQKKQQKN